MGSEACLDPVETVNREIEDIKATDDNPGNHRKDHPRSQGCVQRSTETVTTIEVGILPLLGHSGPQGLDMVGCQDRRNLTGGLGNVIHGEYQLDFLDGTCQGGESHVFHVIGGVIHHGFNEGQASVGSNLTRGDDQDHGNPVNEMKVEDINQQLGQSRAAVRFLE